MTPAEIRTEMLGQHAEMRALIARAAELATRLRAGEDVGLPLRQALGTLADAAHAHNAREEALLGDIIPTVDAWGPARAVVMDEQHRLEHQALHAALESGVDDGDAVDGLLARMLRHMEREEEAVLSEEVLRDDTVTTSYFGG